MSGDGNLTGKVFVDMEDQEACHEEDGSPATGADRHQRPGSRSNNNVDVDNMSHTVGMFKKYLFSKSIQSGSNSTMEESLALRARSRPLPVSKFGYNMLRRPSRLEQELFPGIGDHHTKSLGETKIAAAQLTIFYAGTINVYDNVPVDKAHAIMLLAGESSLSKPMAFEMPKIELKKPLGRANLASMCKLEAEFLPATDLPIARKLSLQHFLAKRRFRITSKYPYCRSEMGDQEDVSRER